ncbi:MAG TPA: carboxypeptidase regulatory-like domain-containing protein [Kofleriaceae bacterium]|nr:carboxypeptidase regulatory-like domain-containing protein [Kofleriaceae bacterium]
MKRTVVVVVVLVAVAAAIAWKLRGHAEPGAPVQASHALALLSAPLPPPALASLAGRITRASDHAGVGGALVSIALSDLGATLRGGRHHIDATLVTTDASGAWRAPAVAPGRYVIAATALGYLPGSLEHITVAPGEQRTGLDLALAAGGTRVHGTVADVGGGPIAGARVTFRKGGRMDLEVKPDFVAQSGADGAYQIDLPAGSYAAIASHDDYASLEHPLELGTKPATLDFALIPGATIRGEVIARDTGKPVPDAEVEAHRGRAFGGEHATSDADGKFAIHGLRPGAISLEARGRGIASSKPTEIEVGVGEEVDGVRVVVDRAFTVSGRVVQKGEPTRGIAGVQLGMFTLTGAQAAARAPSAADGAFEIDGVRPGSYMAYAFGEGHVAEIGKPIEVPDHDVRDVIVELSAGVTLSGRVEPGMHATLGLALTGEIGLGNAFQAAKLAMMHAETDATGAFVMHNVPAGSFELRATSDDGPAGKLALTVGDTDQANLIVPLETRATVTGRVVDTHGAPVAGLRIAARPIDARPMGMAMVFGELGGKTSDADGAFRIVGLEPGRYRVTAEDLEETIRRLGHKGDKDKDDPKLAPPEVELAAGTARDVTITVEARDGVIRGVVVGTDGQPVPDAWVSASADLSTRVRDSAELAMLTGRDPVLTDGDGKFVVDKLRPGSYTVVAEGPRGASRTDKSGVKPGESVTLTLQSLGTLSGHVTVGGAPVTDYELSCHGPAGMIDREISAPDGGYEYDHLAPGSYDCTAEADAGTAHGTADVPTGPATLELSLVPYAQVTGTVVSVLDGRPVPGVQAIVTGPNPTGRDFGAALTGQAPTSDATGRFEVDHVASGAGMLMLFGKNQSFQPIGHQTITTTAGQRLDVGPIKVVPPRTGDAGTFGLSVSVASDKTLSVDAVAPGGPAALAGVVAGDHITAIDGKATGDLGPVAASVLSSGQVGVGVTVVLTLARGGSVTLTSVKW